MNRIIIESPYAGESDADRERHEEYARRAMADSLARGEAPLASHLLYTQMLDDTVPSERRKGIEAGMKWAAMAHKIVIYADLGVSRGMADAIEAAAYRQQTIEFRWIDAEPT